MEYYHVEIPRAVQPSLVLAVENDDLGIAGGLQDRVIQVYDAATTTLTAERARVGELSARLAVAERELQRAAEDLAARTLPVVPGHQIVGVVTDRDLCMAVYTQGRSLSEIAYGQTTGLLTRAADVTLKERRRLLLMVRETPLNLAHLRNMTAVTEMGGIIFPPLPAFYHRPQSIDELVNDTVERVLALLATLLVAVLNLPGLVIYLILRPARTLAEAYEQSLEEEALLQEIEDKRVCPGCGRHADRIQHDRRVRRNLDGHGGDEGLAHQPGSDRGLHRAGGARQPLRRPGLPERL